VGVVGDDGTDVAMTETVQSSGFLSRQFLVFTTCLLFFLLCYFSMGSDKKDKKKKEQVEGDVEMADATVCSFCVQLSFSSYLPSSPRRNQKRRKQK